VTSKIFIFPFLYIFAFWDRQGCCPCSYVSSDAMRNSNLRSSLSLKVCVLNWFYVFEKFILIVNKKVVEGVGPWNNVLNFQKWRESLKALHLEMISSDIWWNEEVWLWIDFILVLLINFQSLLRQLYNTSDRLRLNFTKKNEITDDRWKRWMCT